MQKADLYWIEDPEGLIIKQPYLSYNTTSLLSIYPSITRCIKVTRAKCVLCFLVLSCSNWSNKSSPSSYNVALIPTSLFSLPSEQWCLVRAYILLYNDIKFFPSPWQGGRFDGFVKNKCCTFTLTSF